LTIESKPVFTELQGTSDFKTWKFSVALNLKPEVDGFSIRLMYIKN